MVEIFRYLGFGPSVTPHASLLPSSSTLPEDHEGIHASSELSLVERIKRLVTELGNQLSKALSDLDKSRAQEAIEVEKYLRAQEKCVLLEDQVASISSDRTQISEENIQLREENKRFTEATTAAVEKAKAEYTSHTAKALNEAGANYFAFARRLCLKYGVSRATVAKLHHLADSGNLPLDIPEDELDPDFPESEEEDSPRPPIS